jgi:hypothetical protein
VRDHVRRHTENAGDLLARELRGLDELRILERHGQRVELHALFEDGDLAGIRGARIDLGPVLAQSARRFR